MPTIKSDSTVVFNTKETPIVHGRRLVGYIASVKNTPEGLEWIKRLRKLNKGCKVVTYATATNRREKFRLAGKELPTIGGRDCGDKVPASVADRFRVYVKVDVEGRGWYRDMPFNKVVLP